MRGGLRLLAVVPARGGSKGVPLKNIRPVLGRPLIAYVADVIREAGCFDRAIVSTDHPRIAAAARRYGLDAPFRRPARLSGDRIGDWDVLHHALLTTERLDRRRYDVVVMLQPTCPLRTASHVTAAIDKLLSEGWDAVWTLSKTDLKYHPLKQLTRLADGRIEYFDPRGARIVARQELETLFYRNGAAYVIRRSALLREETTKPRSTGGVVIDDTLISIDTLHDFQRVEALLRARSASRGRTLREAGSPEVVV